MSVQTLIDTGAAWELEGFIGRQCMDAIDDGAAVLGQVGHRDFWGNYIPGRWEVISGTVGSVRYAHGRYHGQEFERDSWPRDWRRCSECRKLNRRPSGKA